MLRSVTGGQAQLECESPKSRMQGSQRKLQQLLWCDWVLSRHGKVTKGNGGCHELRRLSSAIYVQGSEICGKSDQFPLAFTFTFTCLLETNVAFEGRLKLGDKLTVELSRPHILY
jgi:hypothetical protein